jgi:hypothetical protein
MRDVLGWLNLDIQDGSSGIWAESHIVVSICTIGSFRLRYTKLVAGDTWLRKPYNPHEQNMFTPCADDINKVDEIYISAYSERAAGPGTRWTSSIVIPKSSPYVTIKANTKTTWIFSCKAWIDVWETNNPSNRTHADS